jgi:hypothetical protein
MLPPAGPAPDPQEAPAVPSKGGAFWKQQIDLALAARKEQEPVWEANDKAYAPRTGAEYTGYAAQINTNRDFTLVERKKADLFYQRPDVTLQPSPLLDGPMAGPDGQPLLTPPNPQTGQQQPVPSSVALQAHQEIVNELLGPDGIDATRMVHQTLFDVLDLSGVGFTKMGYESVTTPVAQVDQLTGQTTTVPVPVYEDCFWHHFGPKQALVPHDFRSTEWDRAPWLGYQFTLPLTEGTRAKYQLPPDFTGGRADETQFFERGASAQAQGAAVFTGVELWYRSCLFRDDRPHPDHLTHLVLVHGIDAPVLEEDSPDQTLDGQGGLTPDSLLGFPIHPLNMRTRTDTAWPPADATITRPLVNELNISREQNLQFRDAMTLRWQYNTDTLPADALSKIVRSPIGGMIGVPGDAYTGEGAIKELPQGTMPRENFAIADYIDNDVARSWALDAGQQGVQSTGGSTTATEQQIVQANANARLDFERGIVLQWYCQGVTKFSTLVQRYLPVARAAQIVGPVRAQLWDVWRKQVPSSLAFTAMPDSALRVDQAVDRKQAMDFYSFVANDPFVQNGRQKLLEKLFRKFHLDPEGIVSPPNPPKPQPPSLALSFKGEDLVGPQAPIVIEILQQQGIQVSPQAIQLSQGMLLQAEQLAAAQAQEQAQQAGDTKHPGKQAPSENLSKHHSDQSGAMQGIGGAPSPMGAGGTVQ